MAAVARIQERIYYGYGKAAEHLGLDAEFFRSANYFNPIVSGNSIGTIKVALTFTWNYQTPQAYGQPKWLVLADARSVPDSIGIEPFDYFVIGNKTYFLNQKNSLQPLQAVECNRTINIIRWEQDNRAGFNPDTPYSGAVKPNTPNLGTNIPVSLLEQAQGRNNEQRLPTDTLLPRWIMLMPKLGDFEFKNRDIVEDEAGNRYVMTYPEYSDLGWRIGLVLQAT